MLLAAAAVWTLGAFPGEAAFEARIVSLTNTARELAGLRALKVDPRLGAAARQHSAEMRQLGYFSHASPVASHRSVGDRAFLADYVWSGIGENIYSAEGADTRDADGCAALAVKGWLVSPSHRENLLGEGFTAIGVGVVKRGNAFWATQVFGDAVRGVRGN